MRIYKEYKVVLGIWLIGYILYGMSHVFKQLNYEIASGITGIMYIIVMIAVINISIYKFVSSVGGK